MKEIGQLAGVSQSTVSRILNGTPGPVRIAPETRERVLRVVQERGYSPNPLARGLRGARTAVIGLIVREAIDPFFAAAIGAIGVETRRRNHDVLLGSAQSRADDAAELRWVLETRHCDGLLLVGDLYDQPRLPGDLEHLHRPVLALCVGTRAGDIPTVNTDNAAGAELALTHLWDLGHRRIAFLDADWLGDVAERRERFGSFLAERGEPPPDAYLQLGENSPSGGYRGLRALLGLRVPPTAVFASTDVLAIGAMKAASDLGLRVPCDLSVVGFDDIPLAPFVVPSLTTVRQPLTRMAEIAVSTLLAMVDDRGYSPPAMQRLLPELIVRGSCGAPPR
ncbi:MAG: LacI family DNA-binding transcriptional regulator [Candidatus Dormibacteraeota bacterium]|nr:LacI family DNA-binding transcriptional regulator [Candidatus Dormibacteraeota bacterium]MBO0760597.1 LacI family DNA-binding transcriptional regulator [Candidatus Dormibacteraeota bacterium]